MLQVLPVTLLAILLGSGGIAAAMAADVANMAAVVPIVFMGCMVLFFVALTVEL
jgi:hypothetical protein